jgi:hypothetical protein
VTLAAAPGLGASARSRLQPSLWPALGGRGRGAGSDPLRIPLLAFGRLGLQPGLGLAQPVFLLVGLGGFSENLGDLVFEFVEGAIGLVGGVAGQLGDVQRQDTDADQADGRAQLQGMHEEPGQGLLVADAKTRDGHMVRGLVAGQHPEGQVLDAAPLDLPRRAHPQA